MVQLSDLLIWIIVAAVGGGMGSWITILGQRQSETRRRKKEIYEILRRDLTDIIDAYAPPERGLEEKFQASFDECLKVVPKRIKNPRVRKAVEESTWRIWLEHEVTKNRRLFDLSDKLDKLSKDVFTYEMYLDKSLIEHLHGIILFFDKIEPEEIINQFHRIGGLNHSKLGGIRNLITEAIRKMR